MTHKDAMWDGLPRFSARSVGRSDAAHRKPRATPSESLGLTPFRPQIWTVGGVKKSCRCGASPATCLLPDGPYLRSLWAFISEIWYKSKDLTANP